jgi:hypothetical protein
VAGDGQIEVTDHEALSLTIAPAAISEAGGIATGTVVRGNTDDHDALTITLASNDTSEATVPATITIPAGEFSTTFLVTAVDDAIADRTQHVIVSASAAGFVGGSAALDVADDEPVLALALSGDLVSEHAGTLVATVSRVSPDLSAALIVNVTSSDETAAVVPDTVTILAGQASAVFTVTGVDDSVSDGVQRAVITVAAPGYLADAKEILVADDERPYQNPREPLDVEGDTFIAPRDALLIINILNTIGGGPAAAVMAQYHGAAKYPDANGDNFISPQDALRVINRINAGTGGSGEGESPATEELSPSSRTSPLATALVDEVHARAMWAWYRHALDEEDGEDGDEDGSYL